MDADGLDDGVDCIVLGPDSALESPPIAEALAEHRWTARAIDDIYLAMAELCLEVKARATRAAWGLSGSQNVRLILAALGGASSAGTVDQRRRLVRVVQKTYPDVPVLEVVNGRLQTIDPLEIATGRHPSWRDEAHGGGADHDAPPAVAGQIGRRSRHDDEGDEEDPSAITADELAMLFESDADRADPGEPRR